MNPTPLPPLTQLIASPGTSEVPDKPILVEVPVKARTPVLRIHGTKDTTAKVLAALQKRAGRSDAVSSYARASERVMASVKYVIRTGIPSFDEATGGFPFSKVIEVYGLDNCGKTSLAMLACGNAKQGEIYEVLSDGSHKKLTVPYEVTVLYHDNENSLEEGERMIVYDHEVDCIAGECDTIDQMFKDVETTCETIAAIQKVDEIEARKDKNFIAPIQFVVVVTDTIAGTATREEIKQDWSKQDYKRQPAQLREGFRNTIRRLKEYNLCWICTNQVGDSFKPKPRGMRTIITLLPQESDFTAFGGKALRYYAHMRIFVCKVPNPYKLAPGQFADGLVIHFFVAKNRMRMPLRSGRMVLLFKNALCQNPKEYHESIRPVRLQEMVEFEHSKGNKKFTLEDAEKFVPQHPPGGFSPIFSILEHLVYMRFVKVSATKSYKINFAKYGITQSIKPTDSQPSLQEMDTDLDREEGDIEFSSRLAWPEFYRTHETEISVLFDKCVQKMFAQNGVDIEAESEEMEVDADLTEPD
jgi:RecA/RadA recombinase